MNLQGTTNCGRALFADAVGTTVGSIFGTSTIEEREAF